MLSSDWQICTATSGEKAEQLPQTSDVSLHVPDYIDLPDLYITDEEGAVSRLTLLASKTWEMPLSIFIKPPQHLPLGHGVRHTVLLLLTAGTARGWHWS